MCNKLRLHRYSTGWTLSRSSLCLLVGWLNIFKKTKKKLRDQGKHREFHHYQSVATLKENPFVKVLTEFSMVQPTKQGFP